MVGQRVILRPWAQGGNGPQMTQMHADEGTNKGNTSEKNGHRNEPTSRAGPFHLRSSASSADKKSGVSVSLTMIVRDEESNLLHCLSSIAGLFDEIVVVDTGSTDRTAEIAREFRARVFDFVWVNDLAAARNAAIARATAGQPAEARWRRILTLKRPDQFCSVDQGIYGHLTRRNLAVLAEERGDSAEAFRLWKMVLDACPGDAEAMARGEA